MSTNANNMFQYLDLDTAITVDNKQELFDSEVLHFRTHPLHSILAHADICQVEEEFHAEYSRVFNDPEALTAEFSELDSRSAFFNPAILDTNATDLPKEIAELADKSMQFFFDKILMRRLSGEPVSDWQRDFLDFYSLAQQQQCRGRHLKRFCKLPQLYVNAQRFGKMIEQLDSLPSSTEPTSNTLIELIPLQVINRNTLHQRNKTIIYFRTENNNLFELRTQKNPLLEDIVMNVWREPVAVHTQLLMVGNNTDYDNFYYYSASDIEFASTPKKH